MRGRIQSNPRPKKEGPGQWRSAPRPVDWHLRVKAVLKRDPTCVLCHRAPSAECDHIGDPHDHNLSNLRGLCQPCHRTRTGGQGAAASAAARGVRGRGKPRHPGLLSDEEIEARRREGVGH